MVILPPKLDRELSRVVYSDFLVGFTHYNGAEIFSKLKIGSELTLSVELDNLYDEDAVVVFYQLQKLGYLKADSNTVISKVMRAGYDIFTCHIQSLDPSAHPEQQVRVVVKVKENTKKEESISA